MFHKDLLIVDDSEAFTESIADLIEDEREYSFSIVSDGYKAIESLEKYDFRVVLLDLKMPGMSGLDVLNKMAKNNLIFKNYVVVLTGEITIENAVSSLQFGARDFVQKPTVVEFPELFLQRIDKGMEWQENRLYHERLQHEKEMAIQESQLIVKSVGHDMSGSYYGSVVLRLQSLLRKNSKLSRQLKQIKSDIYDPANLSEIEGALSNSIDLAADCSDRIDTILDLMKFFKNLGESLKELGNAIAVDKSRAKVFDFNHLAKNAVEMFIDPKTITRPEITYETSFVEDALPIYASEEDMLRVFMNLIENAYKAMEDQGTISIRTYREGKWACVTISDTGCGIPEENLERIWRPDFTHWKSQTGTGLGLLICRKAVENFDGKISCESSVGKGTSFTIKFKVYKRNDVL
jgi:signal transduction histidine kinase